MIRVAVGVGTGDTYDELMLRLTEAVGDSNLTIVIAFGDFTQIHLRSVQVLAAQLWLSGASVISIDPSTIYGKLRTIGIGINAVTAELTGDVLKRHCQNAQVDLVYVSVNFNQRIHWQDPKAGEVELRYEPRFIINCAQDHDPKSEKISPYFKVSTGQL